MTTEEVLKQFKKAASNFTLRVANDMVAMATLNAAADELEALLEAEKLYQALVDQLRQENVRLTTAVEEQAQQMMAMVRVLGEVKEALKRMEFTYTCSCSQYQLTSCPACRAFWQSQGKHEEWCFLAKSLAAIDGLNLPEVGEPTKEGA